MVAAHGQWPRVHLRSPRNDLRWIGGDLLHSHPAWAWNNGFIESFNNRLRDECLNRNALLEARVVIGNFKDVHNHWHHPWAARSSDQQQEGAGSTTAWTGYRRPATESPRQMTRVHTGRWATVRVLTRTMSSAISSGDWCSQ